MKRPLTHGGACSLTAALCRAHGARLTAQITPARSVNKPAGAAKDTLARTRVRTELKKADAAISVATQKLLQDTNSKSSADLLVYTTGTEVADRTGTRSRPYVSSVGSPSHADEIVTFSDPASSTRVIIFAATPHSYPAGGGDVGASILTSFNNPNPDTTL